MPTIDRHYFDACLGGARRRGIDVDSLLRDAGIDPAHLEDFAWRGETEAMAALVRGIWTALGDEFMGFTAQPMPPGAFAFACELALAGPTMAEGLDRAIRFYNLAGGDICTTRSETADRSTITAVFTDPARDPAHYFGEFWLIIWHRLACWLAKETAPMIEARFDYPRPAAYFEEFKYLFPCPHVFAAQGLAIVMDRHFLHGPVRRTREELDAMLREAPLAIMTIPASDRSLSREVRMILRAEVTRQTEDVASDLELGEGTLRRRLRGEGASLSAIRENIRRDMATRALSSSGRSVEAIAAALGYEEARSFTRAFRAWTGMSPSRYRAGPG
jgi:AraC-like DNA-binding protein